MDELKSPIVGIGLPPWPNRLAVDLCFGSNDIPVTDERSLIRRIVDFANSDTSLQMITGRDSPLHLGLLLPEDKVQFMEQNRAEYADRYVLYARQEARRLLALACTRDSNALQDLVTRVLNGDRFTQIQKKPVIRHDGPSWTLEYELCGMSTPDEWLHFAACVLLADFDHVCRDLGHCHLKGCDRYFVVTRGVAGKPRTKYCSEKHRIDHHNGADSTRRSRNARQKKRTVIRKSKPTIRTTQ
jgi:hypothetical protein